MDQTVTPVQLQLLFSDSDTTQISLSCIPVTETEFRGHKAGVCPLIKAFQVFRLAHILRLLYTWLYLKFPEEHGLLSSI